MITWEYLNSSQTAAETMNRIDQIMDNHVAANMNAVFFKFGKVEQHIMLLAMNHGVTTQDMSIQALIRFNMRLTQLIIEDWNYTPGLMCFRPQVYMRELPHNSILNGYAGTEMEIQ